jgi:hypothetical protein
LARERFPLANYREATAAIPVISGGKDENHGKQAAMPRGGYDSGIGADRETHDTLTEA